MNGIKVNTERMGVCPRTGNVCSARLIIEGNHFLLDNHIKEIVKRKNSVVGVMNSLISKTIGAQNPYDAHLEQAQAKRSKLDAILSINCVSDTCVVGAIMEKEQVYGR